MFDPLNMEAWFEYIALIVSTYSRVSVLITKGWDLRVSLAIIG